MPFIKRVIYAGQTVEIEYHFTSRYSKNIPRGKNENITPDDVKNLNERNAEKRLRLLINNNYAEGDLHLTLTYAGNPPPTLDESKKNLTNFIRRLKRHMQKTSGKELKYITVTEYLHTRIHHHLVINYSDIKEISKLWGHGIVRTSVLDNTGDYARLAHYLIKETRNTFDNKNSGRRYNPSKNLEQPIVKVEILKRANIGKPPTAPKGYELIKDSENLGTCSITGNPYTRARFIKIKEVTKNDRGKR